MKDEDRCEAEIVRIVKDPDHQSFFGGSRRVHRREYRRCRFRHVTYNTAMYPSAPQNSMHAVTGMVCNRHTGYLQRKWSVDWDE
jgi:hypothetical protein